MARRSAALTRSTPGELVPFERDTLTVLRQVSQGRPGILLNRANELLQAGAEAQKGLIDGAFATRVFCRHRSQYSVASDRGG